MAFPTLIDSQRLQARVRDLSAEIRDRYEDPVFVAVLKGARPFANAIFDALEQPRDTWQAMRLRSYQGTESTGKIQIIQDFDLDLTGRDVLVLEDIVDTGRTIRFLDETLRDRGARTVDVWTLLSKPSRRVVEVDLAGVGFEIPDEFVIGFGMDLDERYRELPYIATWNEDAEREYLAQQGARASGREAASG